MKNYLKTLVLCMLLFSVSCEKKKIANPDQVNEEKEMTPLEANTVANNVIINGGTKETGAPPTPNEAISLDISGSSSIALLGEGFDVSLDSDAAITGVYLIFKSEDGSAADSYYDINLSANTTGKNVIKKKKTTLSKVSKTAKFLVDETLDVDFNEQIEPGTFCYEICVYDAAGNISAPQELCVTVESWGGFSDLNGEWNFTKEEEDEDGDGLIYTYTVGEEDCDDTDSSLDCTDGTVLPFELCYTILSGTLVFNSDGTYSYVSKDEDDELDYEASYESCMIIKDNIIGTYTSSGNWAYNSEEKKLVIVEYSYVEEYSDGDNYEDMYAPGDGDLIFYGTATISNGTLTIFENFEDEEYSYTSYWDKK